jgi:cytochrome c oxidase assembly protein subunit 15
VALLFALARKSPLHPRARKAAHSLIGMVGVQVALGISTLIYFVPTPLAAAHQVRCAYVIY